MGAAILKINLLRGKAAPNADIFMLTTVKAPLLNEIIYIGILLSNYEMWLISSLKGENCSIFDVDVWTVS